MNRRPRVLRFTLSAVAVVALAALIAGCSSGPGTDGDASSSTVASGVTSTSATSPGSSTTTTPALGVSEYDKELAKTATVQRDLSAYLNSQGAPEDDPRFAIIYGLRARSQAITGRQALDKGALDLADTAMRDIYSTLNRGKLIAEGDPAQILSDAYSAVETLGIPSEAPDRAATMLDEFIAKLAPMLDEAKTITPTTATP